MWDSVWPTLTRLLAHLWLFPAALAESGLANLPQHSLLVVHHVGFRCLQQEVDLLLAEGTLEGGEFLHLCFELLCICREQWSCSDRWFNGHPGEKLLLIVSDPKLKAKINKFSDPIWQTVACEVIPAVFNMSDGLINGLILGEISRVSLFKVCLCSAGAWCMFQVLADRPLQFCLLKSGM